VIRLSVDTKHTPKHAVDMAVRFFTGRGLMLDEDSRTESSAVLSGGGGFVSIVASAGESKKTEVILETREWEYDVRRFMATIA
jgi:hypothetical protein